MKRLLDRCLGMRVVTSKGCDRCQAKYFCWFPLGLMPTCAGSGSIASLPPTPRRLMDSGCQSLWLHRALSHIARGAARLNVLVRLDRRGVCEADEHEKPRQRRSCRLPLSKGALSTIVSARADTRHTLCLLKQEVKLALWRTLCWPAVHTRRTVLLMNAQAITGSVAKGC